MSEVTKATTKKLVSNPAPEILKAHRFEGFRDKLYGKVDDDNALKVKQMILTNSDGRTHYVTVSAAQMPYIPAELKTGDVIMVRTRQTVKDVTNHPAKDEAGKDIVRVDSATGEFPTAMVDGLATETQRADFNADYQALRQAKAIAKAEKLKAEQSAEVMKARIEAVKTLSEEDKAFVNANQAVFATFGIQ
jgi:hypothetical protein